MSRYKKGSLTESTRIIKTKLAQLQAQESFEFLKSQFNYSSVTSLRAGIHWVKYKHFPLMELICKCTPNSVTVKRAN